MTKRTTRVARIAIAALFAGSLALATSACSFATLDPNHPAAGVNASAGGVQVMNVVLVASGTKARLIASVLSAQDDTLVSVSGAPVKIDGSQGKPFTTVQVNRGLSADVLTKLDDSGITLSSPDLGAGQTANVTFTFSKSGDITVQAPITSPSNPDYNQSGSPTPVPASPSATPNS